MSDQAIQRGIENVFSNAAQAAHSMVFEVAAFMEAPSVLYRPKIYIDEGKWCALYGENLQDGVAGFGDSPALAMADFDKNWAAVLTHERNPNA